ncbi:MAG: cobalt ECF transporter T component CbiQ [Thermodesulfobacteriota bacterium]|nr:cobalt ECF transporter T component CbiQ [Thermodesulfobacteriota bacterium]
MIIKEDFSTGVSFIHGVDPRVKIVVSVLFSVVVAVSNNLHSLLVALSVSVILAVLARLSIIRIYRHLLLANGLILFLWVFLPFAFKGEELFSLGPLVLSKEGVMYALRITVKCNTILLIMIATLSTTSVFNLGHAMGQLRVPDKIIHLFLFTYRYIHVIFQEYLRLTNAMKVRGFVPRSNIHTYRSYAYLVGMLLVRSYDRAERIHSAMLLRGFDGRYYSLNQFSIGRGDILYLSAMLIAILGLVWMQWAVTI